PSWPSAPALAPRPCAWPSRSATATSPWRSTASGCSCPTTPRWSSSSHVSTFHGAAITRCSSPSAPGIGMTDSIVGSVTPVPVAPDPRATHATDVLLAVLQLADGLFPSGGFAHSFGLETYTQSGAVRDAEGVAAFVRAHLEGSAGPADAVAAAAAARGAAAD